jgi:hypothetical protein
MDARVFQEAIRSATVTYPIPFIFGLLLLFALLCLGGSAMVKDWLHVLLGVLGGASFVSAISMVGYAIRFKPELLRSEEHVQKMTVANIIGDKEMDPAMREHLSRSFLDRGDRLRAKIARGERGVAPHPDKDDADD